MPARRPDGRRLFYRSARQMIAARLAGAPPLAVAAREVVFEGDYLAGTKRRHYDLTPDGRHFLMLRPAGDESGEVVVSMDWRDQMRARLPRAP